MEQVRTVFELDSGMCQNKTFRHKWDRILGPHLSFPLYFHVSNLSYNEKYLKVLLMKLDDESCVVLLSCCYEKKSSVVQIQTYNRNTVSDERVYRKYSNNLSLPLWLFIAWTECETQFILLSQFLIESSEKRDCITFLDIKESFRKHTDKNITLQ